MTDLWTVIWKEFNELLSVPQPAFFGRNLISTPIGRMAIFVVGSVVVAAAMGGSLFTTAGALFIPIVMPCFLVSTFVVDTFAGERERGTLETLLASRLNMQAVFFGKMAVPIAVTTVCTGLAALGGWLAADVFASHASFFPLAFLGTWPLLGFLSSSLGAGVSALASEASSTVRGSQQTVTYAVMGFFMVLVLIVNTLPVPMRHRFLIAVLSINPTIGILMVIGVLTIIDVSLWWVAASRFNRERLLMKTALRNRRKFKSVISGH